MSVQSSSQLVVRFPEVDGAAPDQDREWCEVVVDGEPQRIRFHDYDEIFDDPWPVRGDLPRSPEVHLAGRRRGPAGRAAAAAGVEPASLRGLDVGAGNGLVGEELQRLGVDSLVGVDLLQEAADAAERDRPGLYADYVACDLTDLDPDRAAAHRRDPSRTC